MTRPHGNPGELTPHDVVHQPGDSNGILEAPAPEQLLISSCTQWVGQLLREINIVFVLIKLS